MDQPRPIKAIELIVSYLQDADVTHVFGVPGGAMTPFYEALASQSQIRPILCKHETGAAFMAEGYARVRRRLGVCCTTSGPGATNALTGVACAYADSVPLLLLSGQVATSVFGRSAMQESTLYGVDAVRIYEPVTKLSALLVNAQSTPYLMQRALRTALSGRPGPVHLSLPGDIVKQPIPVERPLSRREHRRSLACDYSAIQEAARILLQARRPCILAGNGVNIAGAWDELRAVAELLGIPVATTPKAKGALPEHHPLSLGVFGFGGHPHSAEYLCSGEMDVLLVVGSSLGEFQTNAWSKQLLPQQALIQVDIDPQELGKNYPVDLGIVGDARAALATLYTEIERQSIPVQHNLHAATSFAAIELDGHVAVDTNSIGRGAAAAVQQTATARQSVLHRTILSGIEDLDALRERVPRYIETEKLDADTTPLKPQRLIRSMQQILPEDTLLFVDIGNCISWFIHYYEVRRPGSFFINLGIASMGHAGPASIGGKLAAPERPVVALMGDGAFAMQGMELHTAVDYQIPVIWVVLNDGGFGMVEQGDRLVVGRPVSTSRYAQPIDIGSVAEGLGAAAFRIQSPAAFEEALRQALALERPCVIDARIDPAEVPAPLRMRTESLKQMFAGE